MAVPQMKDPPTLGLGKTTWITFTATKEIANDVKDFGTLFKNTDEGVVYHSIFVDPRYDPTAVWEYLDELGANIFVPPPPPEE